MSLNAISWGPGKTFEHPFRTDPYDDRVSRQSHIWFIVDDEKQIKDDITFAGCKWKLASKSKKKVEKTTMYRVVYKRVTDPPKCGSGRFS